jgi:hypothetical protein
MRSRAIALAVCGAALSACSGIPNMPSFNMPSVSMPSFNIPGFNASGTPVRVESTPAGAEASIAGGPACRTPCTLPAPSSSGTFNVTVSLTGYQPQTIPVRITVARESWDTADAGISAASSTTISPDPVVAALEPASRGAAPPATRKKPPAASVKPKKPVAAAAAAPTPAPAPQAAPPAPAAPPMPTPSGFGPPPAQQPGGFR